MTIVNKSIIQKVLFFLGILITLVFVPTVQSKADSSQVTASAKADSKGKVVIYEFWGDGCSHCEHEKAFLERMKKKYPGIEVNYYEVWNSQSNLEYLQKMLDERKENFDGVPITIIGDKTFSGYSEDIAADQEKAIRNLVGDNVENVPENKEISVTEKQSVPESSKQNNSNKKVSSSTSNPKPLANNDQQAVKETKDKQTSTNKKTSSNSSNPKPLANNSQQTVKQTEDKQKISNIKASNSASTTKPEVSNSQQTVEQTKDTQNLGKVGVKTVSIILLGIIGLSIIVAEIAKRIGIDNE